MNLLAGGFAVSFYIVAAGMESVTEALLTLIVALLVALTALVPLCALMVKDWMKRRLTRDANDIKAEIQDAVKTVTKEKEKG
jgi:membrane protein implicated in regulation of membrane protease activity